MSDQYLEAAWLIMRHYNMSLGEVLCMPPERFVRLYAVCRAAEFIIEKLKLKLMSELEFLNRVQ